MLATSLVAQPIATAPTDNPERTILFYCTEQGGWQASVFFEGRWLDFATLTTKLEPTHFTDVARAGGGAIPGPACACSPSDRGRAERSALRCTPGVRSKNSPTNVRVRERSLR